MSTVNRARPVMSALKTRPGQLIDTTPVLAGEYNRHIPATLLNHRGAIHLGRILSLESRNEVISEAVFQLEGRDFDTIVVRGMSGLLIGPTIAHLMKKELLAVRKPEVNSTSDYPCEGHVSIKKFVILDDLISSYSTCVRMFRTVRDNSPDAELVGLLLYCDKTEFHDDVSRYVTRIKTHSNNIDFKFTR